MLHVPGLVTFDKTGRLTQIAFNELDPLAAELTNAWQSVLVPLGVTVFHFTLLVVTVVEKPTSAR